ncbi:MAG: 30S ribosomal protein S3 [Abditibacteriales bacterium]|nr:30S ribosomal protein S3 [Abditibacteriales bacterium]MDW8364985.1 30S ribosomal protein S3 [Abditibacteriales bacterium]
MGQKVHPYGLRLGINKPWLSRWYPTAQGRSRWSSYRDLLLEDMRIRDYVIWHVKERPKAQAQVARATQDRRQRTERAMDPALSRVEIERAANRVNVILHTAKPGVVIGQRGREVEELQKALQNLTKKDVRINVQEVQNPDLDAQLVAENVAAQIERRIPFRRAMRQTVNRSMERGAKGVKIIASGRLGGNEMSRHEEVKAGKIPLHTLRADIDYGFAEAKTTYGNIGIKCWIYRGDIIPGMEGGVQDTARARASARARVVEDEEGESDVDAPKG